MKLTTPRKMMQVTEKLGLYWRTVEHVPTEQLVQRLRLRVQQKILSAIGEPLNHLWGHEVLNVEWPTGFVPIDGAVATTENTLGGLSEGLFELAGERIRLGPTWEWEGLHLPRLARWHLHYWEWAWTLWQHEDRDASTIAFLQLWRSWTDHTVIGKGDAWFTYPASLRAWVFVNLFNPLVDGSPFEEEFLRALRFHERFIRLNLERDLGGNHLIKNYKALIGLAVFFGEAGSLPPLMAGLKEQAGRQLLADGGHIERSASYHTQVLGDFVDIKELLSVSESAADWTWMQQEIDRMCGWLSRITGPRGRVACFNDCVPVAVERLRAVGVRPMAERSTPRVLASSGFVVLGSDEGFSLTFDTGSSGPPELPGHAHSDCLSVEICYLGEPLVIDPGVSTYEPGDRRHWERSTMAHSTIAIDGLDQSELWSVFRAGRLAKAELNLVEIVGHTQRAIASHRGYMRLSGKPEHRREINLARDFVQIDDFVTGSGVHRLSFRLTFAPGIPVRQMSLDTANIGDSTVTFHLVSHGADQAVLHEAGGSAVSIDTVEVAEGFGQRRLASSVEWCETLNLPVHLRTHFTGSTRSAVGEGL